MTASNQRRHKRTLFEDVTAVDHGALVYVAYQILFDRN